MSFPDKTKHRFSGIDELRGWPRSRLNAEDLKLLKEVNKLQKDYEKMRADMGCLQAIACFFKITDHRGTYGNIKFDWCDETDYYKARYAAEACIAVSYLPKAEVPTDDK
jgi:hypothetical protein